MFKLRAKSSLFKKPCSFKHIGAYFVQSALVTTCLVYTYRHVLHANRWLVKAWLVYTCLHVFHAPQSTCNRRRMTTMAWVRRSARRIKHESVRLQTFRRCLPAQNQLADLSELPQHSATHHEHIRQVSIAQSMYPLEKSRFKWETTKVRLHLSAMLSPKLLLQFTKSGRLG